MTSIQALRKICSRVREVVVADCYVAQEESILDSLGDPTDLGGTCGYASYLLSKVLPGAKCMYGYYQGSCGEHCWVEFRNEIIDITATQFGVAAKVRILPLSSPAATSYVRTPVENFYDWYRTDGRLDWRRNLRRKAKKLREELSDLLEQL